MAYQSEWSIGVSPQANSDPWADQRAAWQAAGGYAGTGMDIMQWNQHKKAMQEGAAQISADRASLTNFLRQYQGGPGSVATKTMQEVRDAADPWGSQRGQYVNQLNSLMRNPGQFSSSPAYKFAFDQGMEALNRNLASRGLANSGTRLAELTKFGQGMAGQQYFNQANLLAKLAGVDASSPSAAAGAMASVSNQQNNPVEWAKLWESGRQANQSQAVNVAKLGNVLRPYYAYAGA